MDDIYRSPKILDLSWGRMDVEGLGVGKDFKLFPGGGRLWDWSLNGTAHEPGVLPAEVEDLLIYGATTVVLAQGMDKRLLVPDETVKALEARGITVHVGETREAVKLYNKLVDEETLVGGLFHTTC